MPASKKKSKSHKGHKKVTHAHRKGGNKSKSKSNIKTLHGRGGYWSDVGKHIGGTAGGIVDGAIGLGKAITGLGAYKVKKNTILETGGPPRVSNTNTTSRIQHREFLGDVTGSTAFAISTYPINPGASITFPWLAGQAVAYEQYRLHGMIFEFSSTSADALNSTNTALGTVILSTEYNPNLPAFTNKIDMDNHEYTVSTSPACNVIHPIECARGKTPVTELYVRSTNRGSGNGSTPVGINLMNYDWGNFYLATVGMQAAAVIGELWVSYDIEFLKPTMPTQIPTTYAAHYYWDSNLGVAPTTVNWFQNLRNRNTGIAVGSATELGLVKGRYLFTTHIIGSAAALVIPTITITGGARVSMWQTVPSTGVPNSSDVSAGTVAGGSAASTWFMLCVTFDITSSVGTIGYSGGTLPTAITSADYWITPVGTALSASRRAVDYDPTAILARRLDDLINRLGTTQRLAIEQDEKDYSECGDYQEDLPVAPRTSPSADTMSSSTMDFVQSLRSALKKEVFSTSAA